MPDKPEQLLEIYKLHAELADRVSQRREAANRLFVALLTGMLIFFAAALRFGGGTFPTDAVLVGGSGLGVLLTLAWFIVIRSYRQLNSGKFATLLELEKQLPFAFFSREWETLGGGKNVSKYWKLSLVETFLPLIFGLFFVATGLWAVCWVG